MRRDEAVRRICDHDPEGAWRESTRRVVQEQIAGELVAAVRREDAYDALYDASEGARGRALSPRGDDLLVYLGWLAREMAPYGDVIEAATAGFARGARGGRRAIGS